MKSKTCIVRQWQRWCGPGIRRVPQAEYGCAQASIAYGVRRRRGYQTQLRATLVTGTLTASSKRSSSIRLSVLIASPDLGRLSEARAEAQTSAQDSWANPGSGPGGVTA
jgi:hypothetical protein